MPEDRRRRIDDLWVALELLGHYEVLGLKRAATKAQVRSAYFELSKSFHPDTVFRKNVGAYRTKMEGIFKRLTEAYDVLGKAKARAEYDAYLDSIGETKEAEEALSGEHEVPPELAGTDPAIPLPSSPPEPARAVSSTPPASASTSGSRPARGVPETPLPPASTPTEEGRRRARELMARKLEGATSSGPTRQKPAEAPAAVARSKEDLVRDLTGAIRASTTLTGGGDAAARFFIDAKRAADAGDLARAVKEMRIAVQTAPDREEYKKYHEEVSRALAVSLASRYLEQASYEEKHGKWAAAALSWSKVCEGKTEDSVAHYRAAFCLLEAKGDLHKAQDFAKRALELRGESGEVRRLLGRIYLAAGLPLNARRELQIALSLDAKDLAAQSLLAQIKG